MFKKDYIIKGTYSDKVRFLTQEIEPGKNLEFGKFTLFDRYVDVVMCAAIIGFTHDMKADYSSNEDASNSITIPMKTMIKEEHNFVFLYRTVILCDKESLSESEDELKKKVDNAFKYGKDSPEYEKNRNKFDSYVLGGINYLYEHFKNVKTREDAIIKMNECVPAETLIDMDTNEE